MTLLTDEARAWGERIVSKMDIANMPEKYRQKAEMDLQLFKAALVADELLEVVRAMATFDGRNNNSHLKDMARAALAKAECSE